MICWGVWNARNDQLFNSSPRPYSECVGAALLLHSAFVEAQLDARRVNMEYVESWEPPPKGVVKVNCDAGFLGDNLVGLGVVMRDEDGDVVGAAVHQEKASWEPHIAEAKASLFAVKVALHHGFNNIIVESDCLRIVQHLEREMSSLNLQ